MSDSFTLKGERTVVNNVGEALRLNNPRGGSTFKFPQWWALKQTVQYVDSAIFKVDTDFGLTVHLVVPVTASTELKVKHDGSGNFTFPYYRGVNRVAVVDPDTNLLYREYQFPAISKGAILTRTVNTYPVGISFTDDGSLTGDFEVGGTVTVNGAGFVGGIGDVTELYVLQQSDTGSDGWTTVTTNATEPFTYILGAGLEGKYLRASTQLSDDTGSTVRNSAASIQVAPASELP